MRAIIIITMSLQDNLTELATILGEFAKQPEKLHTLLATIDETLKTLRPPIPQEIDDRVKEKYNQGTLTKDEAAGLCRYIISGIWTNVNDIHLAKYLMKTYNLERNDIYGVAIQPQFDQVLKNAIKCDTCDLLDFLLEHMGLKYCELKWMYSKINDAKHFDKFKKLSNLIIQHLKKEMV